MMNPAEILIIMAGETSTRMAFYLWPLCWWEASIGAGEWRWMICRTRMVLVAVIVRQQLIKLSGKKRDGQECVWWVGGSVGGCDIFNSTKITVYHVTWRKVKLCMRQLINHVMVLNPFMFLEKNGVQKSRVMQKGRQRQTNACHYITIICLFQSCSIDPWSGIMTLGLSRSNPIALISASSVVGLSVRLH